MIIEQLETVSKLYGVAVRKTGVCDEKALRFEKSDVSDCRRKWVCRYQKMIVGPK